MPTSGTPAQIHSGGPATRCSRDWRPASPNDWDASPQTARSPWPCPSTSASPTILAPTPSRWSTSRSTLHPRQPTCARSAPQQSSGADPPPGGARRAAAPAAPRSPAASAGHPAHGQRGHRRCDRRCCLVQPRCGSPGGDQPDGTDASHVALLSRYPGVTKAMIHHLGGLLVVHSGSSSTGLRFGPCLSAGPTQLE